jgi:pseudouridine-5'-phosphate glycosidase
VRCDSPEEVCQLVGARRELAMRGALLVTVPVPVEYEVGADVLHGILDEAIGEAERRRIGGRDLTPFLLARMAERSSGATLHANLALLEENARVASRIAVALKREEGKRTR